MKYLISEVKYLLNEGLTSLPQDLDGIYKTLKKDGYVAIPNFASEEDCEKLKQDFQENLDNEKVWRDANGSDQRIYGIEFLSEGFRKLFKQDFLDSIYAKYIDRSNFYHFLMANNVIYKEDNLGSGGGWHRDVMNRRQLKFILYLNNVSEENGCFQYLPGSHSISDKWKINRSLKKESSVVRYSEEDIAKLPYEVKDLAGAKGTLLIVDTSGVHRGKPITDAGGERFAVTQYMSDVPFPSHVTRLLVSK